MPHLKEKNAPHAAAQVSSPDTATSSYCITSALQCTQYSGNWERQKHAMSAAQSILVTEIIFVHVLCTFIPPAPYGTMVRVQKTPLTRRDSLWLIRSVITVPWRHTENLDSTLCLLGLVLLEIVPMIPLLPQFTHFRSPTYVPRIAPTLFLLHLLKAALWPFPLREQSLRMSLHDPSPGEICVNS